ncbi:MAG: hypothetical protein KIT22_09195, partial [Verrucomicrobiae bacterium]|nr:hypothetical protein [Verrucomicrobiae bacterium]
MERQPFGNVGRGRAAGVAALLSCAAFAAELPQEPLEFFEQRIRPVLIENCYECHSASAQSKGGLQTDTR